MLKERPDLYTVSFTRKVGTSFTLSDGTYLPKGVLLAAPLMMFDLDPEFSEDPDTFDGFRFYNKNVTNRGEGQFEKFQCVTTSPSYLSFSHGKHACPGRFYAIDEVKLLLCHILLQYDIMYGEGNPRLPHKINGEAVNPDPAQKLSFRKIEGPKKFDFL